MIRIATLLTLVAGSFLAPGSVQAQERVPSQQVQAQEPSIVGTWAGKLTQQGVTTTITVTLKADGTYKTVYNLGNVVVAETGKYTYKDGILTVEPEGG